jgi:hypothetical protein
VYVVIGYSGRVCECLGVSHYAARYRQLLCVPVHAACVRARMRARVRACVCVHTSKHARASVCSVCVFVFFSLLCM